MGRRTLRAPRVCGALLAGAVLLLALHDLGDTAIVHNDEAREVGIIQDVVAGHWLWPQFNDDLLPDKPTLFHWLAAIPCALFGFSETAVRLPSALAAAGTVWWTVEFGSWLFGLPAGVLAGGVLATTYSFFTHARIARPDVLLVLLLALALGSAYRWWREDRRRDATVALTLLGLGTLAKGPVAPALFAATMGLFLLWQGDVRRIRTLCSPAGMLAFILLGLGWYAVAYAGWGNTFVRQHLIGRYVYNVVGGITGGGTYSRRPWYYHVFFYLQHLPGILSPWSPFVALALWRLWRDRGLGDPRMRFLLSWAAAPVLVFTPAQWKLRYYLLPSLPPIALLVAPMLLRLPATPILPPRVTRTSALAAAGFAGVAASATLIYLAHPAILSASDQGTRDNLLATLGGVGVSALVFGMLIATVAVAIACRAWRGLVVLIAATSLAWMVVGQPALEAATTRRDTLKPFARAAAARFPPGLPLAFYGAGVRTVVVYVGRPIPSLGHRADRIAPGQGVIAREAAYQELAAAGRVGPPLATATGRVDAIERATLVLSEGRPAS